MKCTFCGMNILKGQGKIYCLKTGDRYYFCSSKCDRNFMMKRRPLKMKWITKKKK
ncbi:MAG: 50S ribosomal protein L24e [Candidatus Micrarchaeota archaeon]